MNRTELVDAVATLAELPKSAAAKALDAVISTITTTLQEGGSVSLAGFGTFVVKEREARMGRNPRTGEALKIQASKNASFKVAKALKDALK